MFENRDEYFGETFTDLNLSDTEIHSKEFDGCTFEACDFSAAIFDHCSFADCKFLKCNLSLAKVSYSKFTDVSFEDCKIVGVDWTRGDWPSLALGAPLEFRRCAIDGCSFYGMGLKGAVVEECRAHDVDYREADLSDSNFGFTDLANSQFRNSNLTNANFVEATGYSIDVTQNQVKNAKFSKIEALRLLESFDIALID